MKVALAHDPPVPDDPKEDVPEDYGAEYDDSETVRALMDSIRASGHDAADLLLTPDFPEQLTRCAPDLVFNIAEGRQGAGRESVVPSWLEFLDVPYTDSDALTMALTLDKDMSKTLARARDIPTPRWACLEDRREIEFLDLEFPLFVKPNAEGSSMGIRRNSLVKDRDELKDVAGLVIKNYQQGCLVEEFLPGREFCAGFVGNEEPEALPIVEVRTEEGFYPYEDKSRHRKRLECPADIPAKLADEITELGRRAYHAFRCRDFARVDLKLNAEGRPEFLEINPLPGLSPGFSIFPKQAEAAGMSHEKLIGRIIREARTRYRG